MLFFRFLLLSTAGWMNRYQQRILEYIIEENRVLREQLKGRRLQFTNAQREALAKKAKPLGRSVLAHYASLVTPDTLLRWHRRLVARKWDFSANRKKIGRPPTRDEIVYWVLKFARENATWGSVTIADNLKKIGLVVSSSTVTTILRRHGLDTPERKNAKTTWRTFLRAHWKGIAAIDFFTTEVWTWRGLQTIYVLVAIELSTLSLPQTRSTVETGGYDRAEIDHIASTGLRQRPRIGSLGRWTSCAI